MHSQDANLLMLAEAVADGTDVDWDHAEASATHPDERRAIAQLRRLAGVGAAARKQLATWGSLEIRGEVGSGSFGTVYRAWDPRLEREVALKLLPSAQTLQPLASAAVKEGRLLARIHHPNVVVVHGADVFDERVGIWMEFLTGHTLKKILQDQGPFGPYEAALIGRDLCRALAAVHKQGFLHRDIKAQNVMREAGGRIVLMDFGAGVGLSDQGESQGPLAGTPAYFAPEVLAGGAPTVRSDLYSLGVLLYHLVSGEFPTIGQSLAELRDRHAQGKRRLLRDVRPDLPSAFVRAVDRATAADPADRPESAGAFEQLLETTLHGRESEEESAGRAESAELRPSYAARGNRSKWRGRFAAAVLLCVAAIVVTVGIARWPWAVAPAGRRDSVAILPYKNLTPGTENDPFSDDITQDVVGHLASLHGLKVISGASMKRYKDRKTSATEIGTALGAAAVLDCSLKQSGDRVRIVCRLLDGGTGELLWSDTFDRDVKDFVALQSEVSRKIALALMGELSQVEAGRLNAGSGRDFEAFKLYLKGRHSWALRTEEGLRQSVLNFNAAIERDPNYAAAYSGLSDAYTSLGTYGNMARKEAYPRAAEAAEKAVQLDADLAEAHASLGYARKNRFEWEAAEQSFKRALDLKPGYAYAHHWYSTLLTQQARFNEAINEIKAAIALDPLSIGANLQMGSLLIMMHRYPDAVAQYEKVLQMDTSLTRPYRGLTAAYTYMELYDRAKAAAVEAERRTPIGAENQELMADLGYAVAVSGQKARARQILRGLKDRYQGTGEEVAGSIAAIHAGLGEVEPAFEWLKIASDARDPEVGYLKVDPRWALLRDDPRFAQLLEGLGFTK